ncbi:MAG: hypothetical protein O2816_14645, partial [Planctomycetota bacterium]|nr:hypothetical protein [Planctomycetota bacterium]
LFVVFVYTPLAWLGLGVMRLSSRLRSWRMVCTLVGAFAFTSGLSVLADLQDPSIGELKLEARVLIAELDDAHRAMGAYPPELPAAADPLGAAFGGWEYECSQDATGYTLSVGSYSTSTFRLYYLPTLGWQTEFHN